MFYFKYSFLLPLSASIIVQATIAQIEAQLDSVSSNSTNWDNLLNEFPTAGATVVEALVRPKTATSAPIHKAYSQQGGSQRGCKL